MQNIQMLKHRCTLLLQCLHKTPEILDHLRKVRGERGKNRNKRERNYKSSKWSAMQHETYDSLLLQHAFVRLACGNAEFRWGGWGTTKVGWGQQYIPEYMTRCSRSDRSQPWLMKPKHFHRCFYTLGSTSSRRPNSTPTLSLVHPAPVLL